MNWKMLLESASESVHDQLRLRHDYPVAENRILRHQIDGRVQLTDSERKELAEIGAKLGKPALAEIATVAQADTILAWHRKFATQTVDISTPLKSVGRPRVAPEIEAWVIRMARENRSWGYDRIQGSLKHLGYVISDQTVGNILKRHGIPPAPERQKTVTWGEFVRSHWDVFVATGFFNSEVWSGLRLLISYVFCVIHFSQNQVRSMGLIWPHPTRWMMSLVLRALALKAHIEKSRSSVKEIVCPWLIYFGKSLPRHSLAELPSNDLQEDQSQGRGHVVFLSAGHPRPIRDGPVQGRQQFSTLLPYDYERKAA
jgi:transposase